MASAQSSLPGPAMHLREGACHAPPTKARAIPCACQVTLEGTRDLVELAVRVTPARRLLAALV